MAKRKGNASLLLPKREQQGQFKIKISRNALTLQLKMN